MIITYGCQQGGPATEPADRFNEWVNLLAGADLSDWNKTGQFDAQLENGVLTISNVTQPGWLALPKSYRDFQLQFEFKAGAQQESGVAIRIPEGGLPNPTENAYEINLSNDPDQQNPTGSIYDLARAKWLENLDVDAWNKMEIKAVGDHLQVSLNGEKVAETHRKRSGSGQLAFQAGDVQFRNVEIMQLPPVEDQEPLMEDIVRERVGDNLQALFPDNTLDGWENQGTSTWEIEEGIIHGYSGEKGGFLVGSETYKDFYLKLQFKIKKEDNSGVFIRHHPDSASVGIENAIECNIYDHNGYAHAYSTGSIATYARAFSFLIDYEDWNTMEIFAMGDHVCLYVNGKKSSEYHFGDQFDWAGHICLQEGFRIFSDGGPSDNNFKEDIVGTWD